MLRRHRPGTGAEPADPAWRDRSRFAGAPLVREIRRPPTSVPAVGHLYPAEVENDRASMGRRVGTCSTLMQPLVDAVQCHVIAGFRLYADDPPMQVLAADNGQNMTARPWTYARDDRPSGSAVPPALWFAYTPDR